MDTIRTLKLTFLTLGAFVFTYLAGHVIMALMFHFEITDWNVSKDMDTALHFAFGLPVLYAQIKITKYAIKLQNQL